MMGDSNFPIVSCHLVGILVLLLVGTAGCSTDDVVNCGNAPDGASYVWDGTVCSLRTSGFNWAPSSLSAAPGGSDLYVAGSFTHFKNRKINYVVRLNNDGTLDTGFAANTDFESPNVIASATDGSGDIYIGGLLTFINSVHNGILRLNNDGSLDSSFDTGIGFSRNVRTIVPTTDGTGDVYVGGLSLSNEGATFENGPIRLNSDGEIDTGFSTNLRGGESSIALATDGSGDLYVSTESPPYVARLDNDGSIDNGFDIGDTGFDNSGVREIAIVPDGSGDIYVSGTFNTFDGTPVNGLVRLNPDGSRDTGFSTDGGAFLWTFFITPALDGSGDIYVGVYTNPSQRDILRLNGDGSIDSDFTLEPGGAGFNGNVSGASMSSDGSGDIFVFGDFLRYQSINVPRLARFTSTGILVE